MSELLKVCSRCGKSLPMDQFYKLASSPDGRIYPWGDEWRDGYCNTWESGKRTTTPVGQYTHQGDSPYGCMDMAGNVWEWTASWYDDKKSQRVVRGGSWYRDRHRACAVFRRDSNPSNRYDSFGFRVVRHPRSE